VRAPSESRHRRASSTSPASATGSHGQYVRTSFTRYQSGPWPSTRRPKSTAPICPPKYASANPVPSVARAQSHGPTATSAIATAPSVHHDTTRRRTRPSRHHSNNASATGKSPCGPFASQPPPAATPISTVAAGLRTDRYAASTPTSTHNVTSVSRCTPRLQCTTSGVVR